MLAGGEYQCLCSYVPSVSVTCACTQRYAISSMAVDRPCSRTLRTANWNTQAKKYFPATCSGPGRTLNAM